MNGKTSYWTIRQSGGWGVKRQGNTEASSVHELQRDAWAEARRLTGGKQPPAAFTPPVRRMPSQAASSRNRLAGAAMPAIASRNRLASVRRG